MIRHIVAAVLCLDAGLALFLPVMTQRAGAVESAKKSCAGCSCQQMAIVGAWKTYGYNPSGELCPGGQIRYPMLRAVGDKIPDRLPAAIMATGALMGFNEPDNCLAGGTCTSVDDVARAWPELEGLCGEGCRLVGPAPTNLTRDWYERFWRAYRDIHGRDPRVDVMAVHCAFTPDAVAYCQEYISSQIELAAELGIAAVWVTEFAALPMEDWSIREAKEAGTRFVVWMEAQPEIEAYFVFAGCIDPAAPWANGLWNSLFWFSDPGRMTTWGEWYARLPNGG